MIRDCENKKLDIILAKSQSRFSRDMEVIEKYLNNKFLEWNIRFISFSDNADTANLGNKKSRQINGLVNEWYLEDVSNNIRSAFKAKMKQGEFISPFPSFGYKLDKLNNNKLVIDPYAANIVKKIFNLYLYGYGYTKIAKYLNDLNIPSPSLYKHQLGLKLHINSNKPINEIKWSTNAIKTILKNELYLGHLIQGKRTTISYKNKKIKLKDKKEWIRYENTHEKIIDEEVFNKVKLQMNTRTKPCKKNNQIHIFSGKIYCLECKHYMKKKNSNKHSYLVCTSKDKCLNKSSIRYDTLENIILKSINEKITKYYDDAYLKEELTKKNNNMYTSKINFLNLEKEQIEKRLAKNKNYLKNLYEDKINEVITLDQFKDLTDTYNNDKEIYTSQLKQIIKDIAYYENKKKITKNNNLLLKDKTITKLSRIVIDEFIDKIYIGKINNDNTRNINIEWTF